MKICFSPVTVTKIPLRCFSNVSFLVLTAKHFESVIVPQEMWRPLELTDDTLNLLKADEERSTSDDNQRNQF